MTRMTVDDGPKRHVLRSGDVVLGDGINELPHLLGADGAIGNQKRLSRLCDGNLNAAEHAGGELSVRVLELGAPADRARRAFDALSTKSI